MIWLQTGKPWLLRVGRRVLSSATAKPLESIAKMSDGDKLHGYTVKRIADVPDFDLVAVQLTHDSTSAQHLHLARSDSNNAFGVGFRTTPMDSTGVAHILEHTTLCGSSKYPVRDPFFKMTNRSLATFMNAFTANDWTMYPFSTLNQKDYYNLMSVYLDSVFHPLLREMDFRQEGWRLEHENPQDPKSPILFKGVVFNEMKGVFASPENVYAQMAQNFLYPSHTYSHVSGGDPMSILDLTWEDLKSFHAAHYHPSNSRFFTYGDFSLPAHLEFINSEVLQNFQQTSPSIEVPLEPRWSEPREHRTIGPVDTLSGNSQGQTFVGVSYLLPPITDPYASLVCSMLGQLLVDGPASPFYQSLIDSNIGTEYTPNTGYDSSTKEASFSVGLQGVNSDDVDMVKGVIWKTLENVAREGFTEHRVRAVLQQIELGLKHQTSNFGLSLMTSLMSPWIHKDNIIDLLLVNHNIERFKEESQNPTFLEDLIDRYFLSNKHCLTLVMKQDERYLADMQDKETSRVKQMVSHLSVPQEVEVYESGLQLLKDQDTHLKNAQCLPSIKISDVNRSIRQTHLEQEYAGGVSVQYSEQPTNNITYFRALSGISLLPDDLKVYVPLFCNAITQLGTETLDYREFAQECDLYTGGLNASCHVSAYYNDLKTIEQGVLFSSHCLDHNIPYMFNLWEKLFSSPTLHDEQRLRTIIKVAANNAVMSVANSGHLFAIRAASSGLTPAASISEIFSGMTQVKFLQGLSDQEDLSVVMRKLASVAAEALDCGSLRCAINCENRSLSTVCNALDGFIQSLPGKNADVLSLCEKQDFVDCKNELKYDLMFPVNYVGYSIKTVPYLHVDSPRFAVLAKLMTDKYLHREIREKGGAYGAGIYFSDGIFSFFSYRDPNTYATLESFRQCIEWCLRGEFTEENVHEAQLSVISKMDYPLSAGSRGTLLFLHHLSDDMQQQYRGRVLEVNREDLVDLTARYLQNGVFGSAIIA